MFTWRWKESPIKISPYWTVPWGYSASILSVIWLTGSREPRQIILLTFPYVLELIVIFSKKSLCQSFSNGRKVKYRISGIHLHKDFRNCQPSTALTKIQFLTFFRPLCDWNPSLKRQHCPCYLICGRPTDFIQNSALFWILSMIIFVAVN